jgi:hypothetical protein
MSCLEGCAQERSVGDEPARAVHPSAPSSGLSGLLALGLVLDDFAERLFKLRRHAQLEQRQERL